MNSLARNSLRATGTALLAVLAAVGCSFDGVAPTPPPPNPNDFFAGCFEGPISRGPSIGAMTLVIVPTPDTALGLDACLRFDLGAGDEVLPMTGSVDELDGEQANLRGTLAAGGFLDFELDFPATPPLAIDVPTNQFDVDAVSRCAITVEYEDLCPSALYPLSLQGDVP